MKKALKIIASVAIALILLLIIINQFTMRNIKTDIVINASTEKVWNILMDHESYPDWNPFIKKVSGDPNKGKKLSITVQSEGNSPMSFTPLVLVNERQKEFRWVGKLLVTGVFDGEHYFTLEQIGPNQTKFTQGENFTGILSGIFMKMIKEDTEGGFRAMNKALKFKAENE